MFIIQDDSSPISVYNIADDIDPTTSLRPVTMWTTLKQKAWMFYDIDAAKIQVNHLLSINPYYQLSIVDLRRDTVEDAYDRAMKGI